MSKRKILTMAMALCMAAILVVGGSLAFFTDTEEKTNVFTAGNVQIVQEEKDRKGEDYGDETKKLYPIVDDAKDTAAVVRAFTEGEPTAMVHAGSGYELKFTTDKEEYAGIYYTLMYVEGDDGKNYIYDRSTQICVDVGDVLLTYMPRD